MAGNFVKLDVEALERWLKAQPESQNALAAKLGRGTSYFSNIKRKGTMRLFNYNFFIKTFGLADGAFIKKERTPEPFVAPSQSIRTPREHEECGYWLNLRYSPTTVKVQLMFKDEVVIGGVSKIKGNTQLDFAQAISYASHMCYKFLEQKELEAKSPLK